MKNKRPKTVSTSRNNLFSIFSTLNTVFFGQVTPKPYKKKYHLDPIGFLMDVSGFLKSGSAKKNPDPSGSEALLFSERVDSLRKS